MRKRAVGPFSRLTDSWVPPDPRRSPQRASKPPEDVPNQRRSVAAVRWRGGPVWCHANSAATPGNDGPVAGCGDIESKSTTGIRKPSTRSPSTRRSSAWRFMRRPLAATARGEPLGVGEHLLCSLDALAQPVLERFVNCLQRLNLKDNEKLFESDYVSLKIACS